MDKKVSIRIGIEGTEDGKKKLSGLKTAFATLTGYVKSAINYIDNFSDGSNRLVIATRLMSATFGELTPAATKFTNTLADMVGIPEQSLRSKIALFGQMSESLGMSTERAEDFSEALTSMATQLSMIYNYDFDKMSGMLESTIQGKGTSFARNLGIVVNANTMQNVLNALNIDAKVDSLNTAEQAILRYLTVQRQLESAEIDYGNVVNSVAYQKQLLTYQVERLKTALGNALYPILEKILPILNAILIVVTNLVNIFATFLGFNIDSAIGDMNSAIGDSTDAWGGLASAVNKANTQLRGFDKLNNLKTPTPTTGGGIGVPGINQGLLDAMDSYNKKLESVRTKAQDIAEKIMDWLGFTKYTDEETGEVTWKLRDGYQNIEKIWDLIKTIGLTIAGWKIVSFISDIVGGITNIKGALDKTQGSAEGLWGKIGNVATKLGLIAATAWLVTVTVRWINETNEVNEVQDEAQKTWENNKNKQIELQNEVKDTYLDNMGEIRQANQETMDMLISQDDSYLAQLKIFEDDLQYFKDRYHTFNIADFINAWRTDDTENVRKKIIDLSNAVLNYDQNLVEMAKSTDLTKEQHEALRQKLIHNIEIMQYARDVNYEDKESMDIIQEALKKLGKNLEEFDNQIEVTYEEQAQASQVFSDSIPVLESVRDAISKNSKNYDAYKKMMDTVGEATDRLKDKEKLTKDERDNIATSLQKGIEALEKEQKTLDVNSDKYKLFQDAIDSAKKNLEEITTGSWKTTVDFEGDSSGLNSVIDNLKLKFDGLKTFMSGAKDAVSNALKKVFPNAFAEGGFPEDGLFFANHNELVGKFDNGKTAVANNDQIQKGIAEASYQGMMKALSSMGGFKTNTTIVAEGDTQGLLNFIKFKEKENDRQYGL